MARARERTRSGANAGQAEFLPELHARAALLALETSGVETVLRLFGAASLYVAGERVRVELPGGDVVGTTAGLTAEGFLRLLKDDGTEMTVTAGGGAALGGVKGQSRSRGGHPWGAGDATGLGVAGSTGSW